MRILSGIQSSGKLHIGNYYGAIRQFVDLQNEGEALYFIANLHALTTVRDPVAAGALTRETAMAFLALGLDPTKAILFRQSDIPEITELYWILGTVVPLSNLDRAHSYKDKLARGISAGLRPLRLPGADGRRHPPLRLGPGAGGEGPGAAPRVRARLGDQVQPHLRAGLRPADPSAAGAASPASSSCPEALVQEATAVVPGTDGQKMSKSLQQHHRPLRRRGRGEEADHGHQDRLHPGRGARSPSDTPLYELLKVMLPESEFAAGRPGLARGREGLRRLQEDAARRLPRHVRRGARPLPGAGEGPGRGGRDSSRRGGAGPGGRGTGHRAGARARWAIER